MSAPRVTIALIAYKAADTVREAIDGALAQDVPCEIIVSDDASPDDTYDVACAHVAGYDGPHRVVVRRNEVNQGVTAHLNTLFAMASGEVVVIMAGDDISRPQRVRRLLEAFDADPGCFVMGSAVDEIGPQREPLKQGVQGMPDRFDLHYFVRVGRLATLLGATMAFRREVIDRFGPLRGRAEDNILTLRGVLLGHGRCLPDVLVDYRQLPDSLGNWLFARGDKGPDAMRRRYERTIVMYRAIADDLEHALGVLTDLEPGRAKEARLIAEMYRIEADAREAILDRPRRDWIGPIWRGLRHPGMRRKSAERAIKLLLPKRVFGLR
ncbi:glycosyltransferase family 2 protein [Lysobacter humi (ex Lee et al. 2017)]